MLVLSRKLGEEILIGDGIRVTVVATKGGKGRLGISAPDEVSIRRAELVPTVVAAEHTGLQRVRITPPANAVLEVGAFI